MPPVLKSGEVDPRQVARRLESVNVVDHVGEARAALAEAQDEARATVAEAQREAARLRESASEKGYEAGFRRGYEAGAKAGRDAALSQAQKEFAASHANLVAALQAIIAQFEAQKRDLFIAARQDVLAFAIKVADKLTRRIGAVDREAVSANLDAALRVVEAKTDLVAHVNPTDVAAAERFAAAFKQAADRAANFNVVTDTAIAPGGCRLSTPEAEVDATLDSQLAEIAAVMVAGQETPA